MRRVKEFLGFTKCSTCTLPPRSWLVPLGIAVLLGSSVCFFTLDRPVAQLMFNLPVGVKAAMNLFTKLGVGTYYLLFLGLATAAFWFMGRRASAFKSFYVFSCIALAGIAVDCLRVVLCRYRPNAWIEHGLWGFRPFSGIHYDINGCPSGHAAVAMALAVSVMNLYPKAWPPLLIYGFFIASTRVFSDAHYLSDVILGSYVGVATAVLIRLIPMNLKWFRAPPETDKLNAESNGDRSLLR